MVFSQALYGQLLDPAKAAMLGFIALYCGYVGSMEYGGAIKGFTRFIAEMGSKRPAAVQWKAWIASVGAFFSDLGSPGIVGTVFREKYEKAGISRERLGLLINLTAVPVCSMIPLVGWGLFAIGILNNTIQVVGLEEHPIHLFFCSIPFFCFSLLAILTPLLLIKPWSIMGNLVACEQEIQRDPAGYFERRKNDVVNIDIAEEDGKGINLVLSLAVMFFVLFFFMNRSGQKLITAEVYPFMIALSIAFVAASLAAIIQLWVWGERPFMKSFRLYTDMFKRTLSVTGIMVVSWAFFDTVWQTGVYQFFVSWMGSWCPTILILPIVFLLGAVLSSLTGSAWGTYAVVIPLGIMLAQETGINLCAGIGAAVSGSVYGDISAANSHAMHFSAESAGINPQQFYKIQRPYIMSMGIACVISYGLGSAVDKWYVYMALAVVTYNIVLLINHHQMTENRKNDEKWRKR